MIIFLQKLNFSKHTILHKTPTLKLANKHSQEQNDTRPVHILFAVVAAAVKYFNAYPIPVTLAFYWLHF